ncbi:MAG: hypothetical protein D4R64_09400 [Porphyromonadaceae bacterium]|nr:MAG: hypothetical protein D4R64_09400 [Porphyromonadaceae bacterium]
MPNKKQYITLSLVFIAIIGIPAIQTLTRIMPENRLNGVVYDQSLPTLTMDDWVHFRYQPDLNREVEQKFGFRTFFVRLYNQIDYSLFRQPHGSGVVIGKEGYLYEEWFISAYNGSNYIGDDSIKFKIRQLKQVRNYFNRNGKELMIMIAPGKTDFYPEFIPKRMKDSISTTNYGAISAEIRKTGIPLLDFNQLFVEMKDTASCTLFPQTGTHWSHYGARIAADSLSGFIASLLKRPLPEFHLGPALHADTLIHPDTDLETLMNLFFPLRRLPLCYPEVISQPADGFTLPSALVIGDSFFWEMFNLPLTGRIFKEVGYWYYNSTVYPESYTDSLKTNQLKFPEVFEKTDLVILMANPSNLQDIGWGFIERAINELYEPAWQKEYDKMVKEYIQAIHNTPEWEKQIGESAREKGLPKDSMILLNARYMVEQYLLTNDLF